MSLPSRSSRNITDTKSTQLYESVLPEIDLDTVGRANAVEIIEQVKLNPGLMHLHKMLQEGDFPDRESVFVWVKLMAMRRPVNKSFAQHLQQLADYAKYAEEMFQ